MGDETFEDVPHAGIGVVGVNEVNILSDVVGVQILQWRDLDLGGIHEVCKYLGPY